MHAAGNQPHDRPGKRHDEQRLFCQRERKRQTSDGQERVPQRVLLNRGGAEQHDGETQLPTQGIERGGPPARGHHEKRREGQRCECQNLNPGPLREQPADGQRIENQRGRSEGEDDDDREEEIERGNAIRQHLDGQRTGHDVAIVGAEELRQGRIAKARGDDQIIPIKRALRELEGAQSQGHRSEEKESDVAHPGSEVTWLRQRGHG